MPIRYVLSSPPPLHAGLRNVAPRGERLLAAWERPSGMMFLGRELHQDVSLHRHLRGAAAAPLTRAWSSWTAAAFLGVAGACFPEQGLSGALKKLVNPLQNTSSNTSPRCCFTRGSFQVAVVVSCGLCSARSAAPATKGSPAPPAITCGGSVGVPVAANGSTLVEMEAKFLGSNARICAFTGRHKGLCFFYSSRNKRLVVAVAFVC